ncbi:alpha/beta fold hydrolase [Aquihabitans sp. G128]|uniref:alpha/beta fold hydrolase n=1 Tax=Aquihabitans sp. G128 TaxID=2849779 RepID=UPI001C233787|nr:alpha/beta fold hydrolase [Aquihabitans sp. G128]QXC61678.1 alpha/beta fold hydrolase [Aquihabitans sp. G128]
MDPTPATERPDGETLHAVRSGSAGPAVVLVHGFTQTHVSWAPVAADLAVDHVVTAVDAPGHGGSAGVRADLPAGAALVGRAGSGSPGPGEPAEPAVYVGYSMGGRLALRLALDRPDLVRGLVLLGATAGIDDPDQRAARRDADGALADRLERDGVDAFLRTWLAQPLFADLAPAPDDLAARKANSPAGLASSLRLAGTGTMDPPWWPELAASSVPTLVLAGGRDAKFTALGQRLAHELGAGAGASARFATLPGVGHAAHLQAPEAFASLVRAFVAALPDVGLAAGRAPTA